MKYKFGDLVEVRGIDRPLVYISKNLDSPNETCLLLDDEGEKYYKWHSNIIGLWKDRRKKFFYVIENYLDTDDGRDLRTLLRNGFHSDVAEDYDRIPTNKTLKITIEEL